MKCIVCGLALSERNACERMEDQLGKIWREDMGIQQMELERRDTDTEMQSMQNIRTLRVGKPNTPGNGGENNSDKEERFIHHAVKAYWSIRECPY